MKRNNEKFYQSNLTGRFFLLAIFSLVFSTNVWATAPANDNFANAEVVSGMQIHITRTNAGATKETGEPNHASNAGGKSVWFKWTAPMSRMMNVSTNRTAGNLDTLLQVYTGTALNNLAYESGSNNIHDDFNLKSNTSFVAYQGTTYFIAVDGAQANGQTAEGAFLLDISPTFRSQSADYDNDGQANIAVFRPSAGTFFHLNNSSQQTVYTLWGTNGDVPVAGGENGGNYFLVFRPSNGTWYMKYPACCASEFSIKWGTTGDIPVPEAYGADTSDPAVFRPSDGTWYLYNFQGDHRYYRFGLAGDIPVPGQYTPDGFAEIAVFRPSNGVWYFIKRVSNNDFEDSFAAVQFGQAGDKPVPGDYDGDGLLDIAVYRPSTGTWWVLRSSDGQAQTFKWGIAEDLPTTGDFDGDGRFDFAVFRPSNNNWYIYRSGDSSVFIKEFGLAGDIPVTANRAF